MKENEKENIHSGHRERLKQKYREHGLESFTDVEALELLLFFAVPRRSTNEIAHALLDRFRSFRGVMEADLDELQRVPGIGESAATLLRLVTDLNCRYQRAGSARGTLLRGSHEAGVFLRPYFAYSKVERFVLLTTDSAGHVIGCHVLAEGTADSVDAVGRNVADTVLRDKASRAIMAHNHLTGLALPSAADLYTTKNIYRLLNMIGAELVDHIIFADGDFVSLRDSGQFDSF